MLSDESIFYLLNLAHQRASNPQEPVTAFCSCSLRADTAACTRRPYARRRRSRSGRSRVARGKCSDPDRPSPNAANSWRLSCR